MLFCLEVSTALISSKVLKIDGVINLEFFFIADAQYWYSNYVRPSVSPSVTL